MNEKAHFHIEIPLDQIEEARENLEKIGITDFSPVDNMVHIADHSLRNGVFTGADGQYALYAINRYLRNTNTRLQLPNDFRALPPENRRDLLELVNTKTEWSRGYGPSVMSTDIQTLLTFMNKLPAQEQETDKPRPRPAYRQLRHPLPPPPPRRSEACTCPVPGCNHNSYGTRKEHYCWGHSFPNTTWDGLKWTTYDRALHSSECRVGRDGGITDCNGNQIPDHFRMVHAAQRTALEAGTPPIPGP